MIKSLINRRFPLALRSDRERTEQLIRLACRANEFDIDEIFYDCHVNSETQQQLFDSTHKEYGELLLSSYFQRDTGVYRKTVAEIIYKLTLQCEIRYQTAQFEGRYHA
jgi:hypothetical protein